MPLKTACGGVARRVRRADDRFCGVAGQILVPQPLVFGLLKAFPSRAIDWDTYGPVFLQNCVDKPVFWAVDGQKTMQ